MSLKKIVGCLLLYLLSCNMMNAQIISNVEEAASKMKKEVVTNKFTRQDTLGGFFLNERNNLVEDKNQYVITTTNPLIVGVLVKNKAKEGKGDYSAYWKNTKETANRYTWVFVLDDFKKRCVQKDINTTTYETKEKLSDRLCQLLGLNIDNKNRRDTIVFMEVNSKDLFRPAYNPDISRIVHKGNQGVRDLINNQDIATRRWFLDQQFNNNLPWTRMGYTYDWGDKKQNYIGVTEFILRPNSKYRNVKYHVIKDFLK